MRTMKAIRGNVIRIKIVSIIEANLPRIASIPFCFGTLGTSKDEE